MRDQNGKELTDEEIIKEALDLLAGACELLYETHSDVGHALAFMTDSALKYGQVIYRDDNVLSASADYAAYEQKVYERKMKEKIVLCGEKKQ